MSKLQVEVCIISARGLPRSSLLKTQLYAVAWIDPNDKYCTKIDASGAANPTWKTKFTALIDKLVSKSQDMALHVEVYSREPVFLREKLRGSTSILLKEFLESEGLKRGNEEVGSFQLRKNNKPQGFIDVSIRVSEEMEGSSSCLYQGQEGFNLKDDSTSITLPTIAGPVQAYPPPPPANYPYTHLYPYPTNYPNLSAHPPGYPSASGPGGPLPWPPPPPPPPAVAPSNGGYTPTFLPRYDSGSTMYMNMPSSGAGHGRGGGGGGGPGFVAGAGAGALAAGAVMYGGDFGSGFELPTLHDPHLTVSIDPPF